MNEAPEVIAARLMEKFTSALTRLSLAFGRDLEIGNKDEEQVSFSLDGYPFTLSWEEDTVNAIGRTFPVIRFSLCIWSQTMGSRHSPPENIDTTLIQSSSVYDCLRSAFETIAKEEIRLRLENDAYEQMAKEEITDDDRLTRPE